MATDSPDVLTEALGYAALGRFVVPLHTVNGDRCTCQYGRNCGNPGKHPVGFLVRNGSKQASAYAKQIERWWNRFPTANIGIVCGPSGLVVLDVDPRNGGADSFQQLIETHGPLPETLTAITGNGKGDGRHYVFSDPDHAIVGSKGTGGEGLYPGLEILARGNYFVAAPSLHLSGRRYAWIDGDMDPAPTPALFRDGLR